MKKIIKNISLTCLKAIGFSVIMNTVIYYLGTFTGLISKTLPVTEDGQTLELFSVILMSIIPIIIAGIVFGIIFLLADNAKTIFLVLALIILFVSFAMPFFVPDISLIMALILNLMHVVVGGSVIYFFINLNTVINPLA